MNRSDNKSNVEPQLEYNKQSRRDNYSRDEEYAAEFTADDYKEKDSPEVISMYGWIGLALSVISFFMWPVVLGLAGIVLGFVSRSKGANTLGNIAITVGVISILIRLIMLPFSECRGWNFSLYFYAFNYCHSIMESNRMYRGKYTVINSGI